jgi:signal transduction histidine kinase
VTVTRRILVHVALGVAFVVAVVTAVTYNLVYNEMKRSGLRQLDTYVSERADREEARFRQIEINLELVRGQFLARLGEPLAPSRMGEYWNHWYEKTPDGAWRSRDEFSDARQFSTLWIDKEWQDTEEGRREIVIGHQLCDELLPGWINSFASVYFTFKGLVNVGFDYEIPNWSNTTPAHYPTEGLEWVAAALPKNPPDKGCLWTGMQNDPAEPTPMVAAYLPIERNGSVIGSIGHNMYMHRTLDLATKCNIAGAVHFIVRQDGRLIAHSIYRDRIMSTAGLFKAQKSGDPALASLYRACLAHNQERRFSGFDPGSACYYSLAKLAGPEWFFVTALPQSELQRQAFAAAQWVLWSGLASLAFVFLFIAYTLRRQISQPLAELRRATDALAAGAESVHLPIGRPDELGALAASFRGMVTRVAERENELRVLNSNLEKRVASRTEDLNQALKRERELGEIKSNFVSLVSHEFRTPLGVIMSATEVLQRYFDRLSAEKRERHLDMIFRSTRNLAGLIDEVLLLSRVEEGRMSFSPVPVDMEKLCRSLCDELRSATAGACPINFQANGPFADAVSDEGVLRHILTNLLSNACKYSEPGSPVDFSAERRGDNIVFTIRDHGIGIPLEDQAQIFTSFTRGSNVGARPGTGLGLVIVQRCVQLHGGTVNLQSQVGQGTTFTVSLPVFSSLVAS